MYRNYKCELDFNFQGVSEDCLQFLKSILSKNPVNRLSSEQALEAELFLRLELDENQSNIHILSRKINSSKRL